MDQDLKDLTKSVDFSWSGGFGFDTSSGLNFGSRIVYGVSDVSDQPEDLGFGYKRPPLQNFAFQFHVGYSF